VKNPITKAYQTIDDILMYAANKAVDAWNWTLGGTRDELADFLSANGAIFGSLGAMNLETKGKMILIPANLGLYFQLQRFFKRTEREEIQSAYSELKNIGAEIDKTFYGIWGPYLSLGVGPVFFYTSYRQSQNYKSQSAEGSAMQGFGFFCKALLVM